MVPGIYLMTRRYEFHSLYYSIILIFLGSLQQSFKCLIFDFTFLILTLFIIAAVYDDDAGPFAV